MPHDSNHPNNPFFNFKFDLKTLYTIGSFAGVIITFAYLMTINQLFLFPDTLSQIPVFIAATVAFCITITVCVVIPIAAPFAVLHINNYKTIWLWNKPVTKDHPPLISSALLISYICAFLSFVSIVNIFSEQEQSLGTILIIIFPFVIDYIAFQVSICNIEKLKQQKIKIKINKISYFFKHLMLALIYWAIAWLSLVIVWETASLLATDSNNTDNQILLSIFIGYYCLLSINVFIALYSSLQKRKSVFEFYAPISFIIAILVILVLSIPSTNIGIKLSIHTLKILHFIETPNNAKWYILDPNSKTVKALERQYNDLSKSQFICTPNDNNNCQINKNLTALYGYMAWNLGDQKLLCPSTINAVKDQQSNDCITIRSDDILWTYDSSVSQKHIK